MTVHRVLIDGKWTISSGTSTFQAVNPRTKESLPDLYPVSSWAEVVQVIDAAFRASEIVRNWPGERFAK
ncbi:MAG: aldehyde dehydrogenase (NADP(+)), partial [Planctomycetes bacterium]|nr:aldehyde dehydrogenase (NADP(+)) [Planctomycetota bacterium]